METALNIWLACFAINIVIYIVNRFRWRNLFDTKQDAKLVQYACRTWGPLRNVSEFGQWVIIFVLGPWNVLRLLFRRGTVLAAIRMYHQELLKASFSDNDPVLKKAIELLKKAENKLTAPPFQV